MRSILSPSLLLAVTVAVAVTLALAACSGGGRTLPSGVPEDAQLDMLSDEQAVATCEYTAEVLLQSFDEATAVDLACTVVGVVAASTIGIGQELTCNFAADACRANPPAELTDALTMIDASEQCAGVTADDLGDCTATAGELDACVREGQAALDTALAAIDCSLATDEEALSTLLEMVAPQVSEGCETILDQCGASLPELPLDGFDPGA